MREGTFFNLWKKGELRKTNERFRAPPFLIGPFRVSAGERLRGRVSWQSKEDKSAHGTRVNESKRARLPDPKALLNPLGPPNKGWEASVYVRVHDCVKLRSRSLGKVSLLLTSLLRQKLWECRVAGLRNRRSFLLSFLSIYIYIYKYKSDEMLIFLSFFLFFCCRRIEKICILFENTQL